MNAWADRAKARFSQTGPNPTPKTPETPVMGVLGVPSGDISKKMEAVFPWFHLDADWRKDYAAWQAHRNTCPTCRTSERTAATAGTGVRCTEGQRLHTAYESALDSSPT